MDLIESIKKTSFKEGDVVILKTEYNLSDNHYSRLRDEMERGLPKGVKTVILEGGLDIEILTKEGVEDHGPLVESTNYGEGN